jgi:hypothetical protein
MLFHIPSAVMPRESGASSIPEASRLTTAVSGILGRPVEPGDDTEMLFDTRIRRAHDTEEQGGAHSAAFAVLPNIRVGAANPQEVPSVTLTWSSQGRRKVPATMSCMKV